MIKFPNAEMEIELDTNEDSLTISFTMSYADYVIYHHTKGGADEQAAKDLIQRGGKTLDVMIESATVVDDSLPVVDKVV